MNDAPALPSSRMTARVLMSSLVGTTVEFYDFYIYATAASLIFGPLFFPASVPSAELIGAYASFGVAFVARPFGGASVTTPLRPRRALAPLEKPDKIWGLERSFASG